MVLLYVLPAVVITRVIPNNWLTVSLGILGYCLLVFDVVYTTVLRTWTIYDPGRPFQPTIRNRLTPSQWRARGKRIVVLALFSEYVKLAYLFAMAYAVVSRADRAAFNVPLGLGVAFYYSVTTLATVGYGDILPCSPIARTIAVLEILAGLIYVILVLSVVSTHLQKRSAE